MKTFRKETIDRMVMNTTHPLVSFGRFHPASMSVPSIGKKTRATKDEIAIKQ